MGEQDRNSMSLLSKLADGMKHAKKRKSMESQGNVSSEDREQAMEEIHRMGAHVRSQPMAVASEGMVIESKAMDVQGMAMRLYESVVNEKMLWLLREATDPMQESQDERNKCVTDNLANFARMSIGAAEVFYDMWDSIEDMKKEGQKNECD